MATLRRAKCPIVVEHSYNADIGLAKNLSPESTIIQQLQHIQIQLLEVRLHFGALLDEVVGEPLMVSLFNCLSQILNLVA